jgi:hypothetical protein
MWQANFSKSIQFCETRNFPPKPHRVSHASKKIAAEPNPCFAKNELVICANEPLICANEDLICDIEVRCPVLKACDVLSGNVEDCYAALKTCIAKMNS